MHHVKLAVATALLIVPSVGLTQNEAARVRKPQKAWLPANYRTFACTQTPGPTGALTGSGTVSFDADADGGIDFAVAPGAGGVPTISAHAINTKGTGATNGRTAAPSCGAARAVQGASAATCTVSGDEQSPTVQFSVPLTALGGSDASYVGTVTIVKSVSSEPMVGKYLSDTDLLVVARCDSAALTAKGGKPTTATYDLAVAKK